MDITDIKSCLSTLSKSQIEYIYGRLITNLEANEDPVVTKEEEIARLERDLSFLKSLSKDHAITQDSIISERDAQINFLVVIAGVSSECNRIISCSIEDLNKEEVKLDFGISLALCIIVPAIAAAILRPKVERSTHVETEVTRKPNGEVIVKETKEETSSYEIQGTDDITNVLKVVLPFL
ncbi:MAG TPA: hypothetical protein PKV33_08670 [Methanothrix sp.]|mgnify:CR=1 FL=1|nr:hypothetical protein [Methanothrix sp.]